MHWYLGKDKIFEDHQVAAYYQKLQKRHFTVIILEIYVVCHMLDLTFFVEGYGFTYCALDNGDMESCDIGMVLTGVNTFCVVINEYFFDSDGNEEQNVSPGCEDGCSMSEPAEQFIAHLQLKDCSVSMKTVNLLETSVSAAMTAEELRSVGIFPCSVKLEHLSPAKIVCSTSHLPLVLGVSNLCPACGFPVASFSGLSKHVKEKHAGQQVHCWVCRKEMTSLQASKNT